MSINTAAIPDSLKAKPNWVAWRYEDRDGKRTKVLYSNGRRARSNDPQTWLSFDAAYQQYSADQQTYAGIGFVFTPPMFGIDMDSCIKPDGSLTSWASTVLEHCPSYCEVSPSGVGLKIIGIGELPIPMHKQDGSLRCGRNFRGEKFDLEPATPDKQSEVLIYRQKFFTITGSVYQQYGEVQDCPGVAELFGWLQGRAPQREKPTQIIGEVSRHDKETDHERTEAEDRVKAAINAMLKVSVPTSENDGSNRLMSYARQAKRFIVDRGDALRAIRAVEQVNPFPIALSDDDILRRLNEADVQPGEGFSPRSFNGVDLSGVLAQPVGPAGQSANGENQADSNHNPDRTSKIPGKKGVLSQNSETKSGKVVIPDLHEFTPFPTSSIPSPLAEFIRQGARAICCDESFIALPLLAALASAIGNSYVLLVKRGWLVPSILWPVVVAESGSGKSAPQRLALLAIHERQKRLLKTFDREFAEYEKAREVYERDLADFKKSKSSDRQPPEPPVEPVCPRVIVNDTTIEALARRLKDNPRGVICANDELAGWFGGFNKYKGGKSGGEEAKWLEFSNAQTSIIDRSSSPRPIVVEKASVSITGTIQPGILRKHLTADHKASGMAARLLFAMPPRMQKRWTEQEIDEHIEEAVVEVFDRLFDLEMRVTEDGGLDSNLVRLEPAAKQMFVDFYNRHNKEQHQQDGDLYAAYSKLEEYAARLALVVHCVRWATSEVKQLTQLDYESMATGIELCEWFKAEARRVYAVLAENEVANENRKLLAWIQANGGTVTPRDLHRAHRATLADSEAAENLLQCFVSAELGTWESVPPSKDGGRPFRKFTLTNSGHNPQNSRDFEGSVPNIDNEAELSVALGEPWEA